MARPTEFDPTKVLDEAMQLFWCQGYEATSTQELTRVMGIKPGSLYNTFGDKHTLYLKALDRYQTTVGVCSFAVLNEGGKAAIQKYFDNLIDEIVADPQSRGCFMLNAIIEVGAHDPEVAERAREAMRGGKAMFLAALERAQAGGEIDSSHDLDHLASFLLSTVQGVRVMGKVNPNRAALNGIVEVALSNLT
jgi:TetR/AcrR family transcriptional regulator, transcriptional repressor for nem operon